MQKGIMSFLLICGLAVLVALSICSYPDGGALASKTAAIPSVDFKPGKVYKIVNSLSMKYLEVNMGKKDLNIPLDVYEASGCNCQTWAFCSVKNEAQNVFYIYNVNSGLAIDVPFGSKLPGMILEQDKPKSASQQWFLNKVGQNNGKSFYTIMNNKTGLAMDLFLKSTYNLAAVVQWTPNFNPNQQWGLEPTGNPDFKCPS